MQPFRENLWDSPTWCDNPPAWIGRPGCHHGISGVKLPLAAKKMRDGLNSVTRNRKNFNKGQNNKQKGDLNIGFPRKGLGQGLTVIYLN